TCCTRFVELSDLGIRKEFLIFVFGGPLKGDVVVPRPDALEVGLAPRGLECRTWRCASGGGLSGECDERRGDGDRHRAYSCPQSPLHLAPDALENTRTRAGLDAVDECRCTPGPAACQQLFAPTRPA